MDRTLYVGTVVSFPREGGAPEEHVLIEFVGEGNDGIVFGEAPRDRPDEGRNVLKFYKPQPRFELGVLHHSLKIADELYPHHPLTMPPDVRMQRLVAEMRQRIESPGAIFQVRAYVDLLYGTIEGLIHCFLQRYTQGVLPANFLDEEKAFAPALDECFTRHLEQLLERDAVKDDAKAFVTHCVDAVGERAAARPRESLSWNRLYKLLGLHLVDFISWEELLEVSLHPGFAPPPQFAELQMLTRAASMFHYRAITLRDRQDPDFEDVHGAALATARLVDALADRLGDGALETLRANALNWEARTLLLKEDVGQARALFLRVLDVARSPASMAERHDALQDLARLEAEPQSRQARAWREEALAIRRRLGVA